MTNLLGFKVKDEDVKNVNNTFADIKNTATKMLGAIGIGFSLASINQITEEFTRVKNQIKSSTDGLGDQEAIQQKILAAATETRSQYSETAKMVSNLVKENSELFGTVDEAIAFNNAATMLFKTAGKTNEEIAGLMKAINKSFAKGYVDSETLSQMLERSPEAVELLNKRLGTTSDQLEQMATDGKFTVLDLKMAFLDSADEIEAAFGGVKMTVTDAITVIRNKWGLWLADSNEMLGVTDAIASTMVRGFDMVLRAITRVRNGVVWLGEKLGGLQNLYKLIGIAVGAVFGYLAVGRVISFISWIKQLDKALLTTRLRMVAIIAVIILIALLVEDFIAFMRGEDSLFGTLLENAGVDCDKFRENVIKIWQKLKVILGAIWTGMKNVAIPIFQGIWRVIKTVFEAIGKIIEAIAPKFAEMLDQLANGEVNPDDWIALGEGIAKVAAVVLGIIATLKVLSAVMAVVNAVMAMSPITWIIIGIVALIAAIVLLVKNWDKVKAAAQRVWNWIKGVWGKIADWFKSTVIDPIVNFFKGLWDGIVGIFQGIIDWVKKNWKSIVLFIINPFAGVFSYLYENFEGFRNFVNGVIQSIVGFFTGLWESIKSGAAAAWEGVTTIFGQIGAFFQGVWDTIVNLFTTIGTAVSDAISGAVRGAINAVLSGAIGIINGFISAINFAIGVINAIPGVSISKLNKLEVPQLAQGGYVKANQPQAVIIGDNKREGEIVSPVSKMRDTVVSALQMFAAAKHPSPSTQTMSNVQNSRSVVQNVEINNEFNGDRAIQQKASKAMDKSAKDVTSELARGLAYAR